MNAVVRMAAAALGATAVVLLVVAARTAVTRPDELGGAVLSDDDHRALAAAALRGAPVAVAHQQAFVVLARSPDGRWRVVAETAGGPDLPVGED